MPSAAARRAASVELPSSVGDLGERQPDDVVIGHREPLLVGEALQR